MIIYIRRIRDLREDKDKTQDEIAEYLKIDRKTYNRIENGTSQIKLETAIKLARYYNISLDYIAGFTDEPKKIY